MINPAGIPAIPGDMAALAGHATAISKVGTDFASTGQQVNSTWQGLAGVYEAPEIGQLLAATAPVQSISSSVGDDLGVAGNALGTYATEVAEIQTRMATLRTQAQDFEASVKGDDDWTSDGDKVDRNRQLVEAVNAEMAAFFEAQRRCANTINALYGGQQYTAENGDGQVTPGEYGYTTEQLNAAAREEGALPWGHADKEDRGLLGDVGAFFGGVKDGFVGLVTGLGALIGRDPTTGEWSWSTAGEAWKGLGTFALAIGVYAVPGGARLDQTIGVPGFERGQLGDTLVTAGKSIIAYDQWSEDPARAAGTATFNIVSAIVGTKGAGAGMRGVGTAAQGSRVGAVSAAGTALVRSGEFIGRLPTVTDLARSAAGRLPGFHLPDLSATPRIDVPHHVDVPQLDAPSGARTPDLVPTPGTVGDALARTPDTPSSTPSMSAADVPTPRGVDTTPTPSNDRTPALVGAHAGDSPPAGHASTGSGTDVPTGARPDTDVPAAGSRPDTDGTPNGRPADGTPQTDRIPETDNTPVDHTPEGHDTFTENHPGSPGDHPPEDAIPDGGHRPDGPETASEQLIAEASSNGAKINSDDVVTIGKDPNGRIVWLEEGGINPRTGRESGLQHIINEHADDFNRQGIPTRDIPEVVHRAVVSGEYTGYYQGRPPGRPIFAVQYHGETKYIAVQVGNNGYIVGANPASLSRGTFDLRHGEHGYRGW